MIIEERNCPQKFGPTQKGAYKKEKQHVNIHLHIVIKLVKKVKCQKSNFIFER